MYLSEYLSEDYNSAPMLGKFEHHIVAGRS